MTPRTDQRGQRSRSSVPGSLGTAEAKRRFSELLDRVGEGERFLVSRRGRPAVALVPPDAELFASRERPPSGLAAVAGSLADWDQLDQVVRDVYAARAGSKDRPAPDLG